METQNLSLLILDPFSCALVSSTDLKLLGRIACTQCIDAAHCYRCSVKRYGKGNPYSITERRVPQLIPVLGSQPAGDVSHNPGGRLPLFPPGLQLPSQSLRGLLPISLLGEQKHDGCEQFAYDCYPTASRLRFEPRPFCAWVQHPNYSATEPPRCSVVGVNVCQCVCLSVRLCVSVCLT